MVTQRLNKIFNPFSVDAHPFEHLLELSTFVDAHCSGAREDEHLR
jgi:hypothetical protein